MKNAITIGFLALLIVAAVAFQVSSQPFPGTFRDSVNGGGGGAVGGATLVCVDDNVQFQMGGTGGICTADSVIFYDGTDTFWDAAATGSGDMMFSISGSTPPSPDPFTFHFHRGDAGAVTGTTDGIIFETNGAPSLSLLGPNNRDKTLYFGEPASQIRGGIRYFGSTDTPADTMSFLIKGGISRLQLTDTTFAFQQGTTISTTAGDLTLSASGNTTIEGLTIASGTPTITTNTGALLISADTTIAGSPFIVSGTAQFTGAGGVELADDIPLEWGSSTDASCRHSLTQTPNAMVCTTPVDSNLWIFMEQADIATDLARSIRANPTIHLHSKTAATATEFFELSVNDSGDALLEIGGTGKDFNFTASTPKFTTSTGALTIAASTTFSLDVAILDGMGIFSLSQKTFGINDTTPSVSGANLFTTAINTSPTTITDLDFPIAGTVLNICGGVTGVNASKIVDSGNFDLDGDIQLDVGTCITLKVIADNNYKELDRTPGKITEPNHLLSWTANDAIFPATAPAGAGSRGVTKHANIFFTDNGSEDETVIFEGVMPVDYVSTKDIELIICWAATSATSGNALFLGAFEHMNPGVLDIDADSFDADRSLTDPAPGTSGFLACNSISYENDQADDIVAGDPFRFRLKRGSFSQPSTDTITATNIELYRVILEQP